MIKLICDFCGGEIVDHNDQTCLSFQSFGVSGGPRMEYQLHSGCAKTLKTRLWGMMKISPQKEA